MITSSAVDLIGRTPLLSLSRVYDGPGRLLAKAEFVQPGGSVKDRAAKAIIEAARADGRLKDGMTVVEMTSGNMGAGLAVVCAVYGHPLVVTMSAGNSVARARMLEGLGARLILVPQVDGTPGKVTGADVEAAAGVAREYAKQNGAFYVDQFNADEGIAAHEFGTGQEIVEQLGSGCQVDAWVAAVGSACTFVGVARALRKSNKDVICAVVEPSGCRVLAGEQVTKAKHLIQGTSYAVPLPHWDSQLMSQSIAVTDDEVTRYRDRLASQEGLYVGYSAAANVCGAIKLLQSGQLKRDATVVTVLCDTGLKY